jgi:hypothetical protein
MAKASRITVTARIHDVLRLILAGAEFADIRQYAADHGWKVSERQVRRYIEVAHRHFADATERDRGQLLGRHLMQRRALYARALKANDLRTALQVLRDEAELEGLYPPAKFAPTTPDGQEPYRLAVEKLSMDELLVLRRLRQQILVLNHEPEIRTVDSTSKTISTAG